MVRCSFNSFEQCRSAYRPTKISILKHCRIFIRSAYAKVALDFEAFIASSFRVTEENLLFETIQSGPYSSFECFLCSLRD